MGDIYLTRGNPAMAGASRSTSARAPAGPTARSTSRARRCVEIDDAEQLFFSRSSAPYPATSSSSRRVRPGAAVGELNSAGNDIQPNVRKDGREIAFSSNHAYPGAQGAQDLYAATRASTDAPWSAAGQPRPGDQHRRRRDAPVAVVARPARSCSAALPGRRARPTSS